MNRIFPTTKKSNVIAFLLAPAFFGLAAFSCAKKVPPSELVQIIESPESGLAQEIPIDPNLYVRVQLKPHSYIACLEQKSDQISEAEYERILDELAGSLHFTVSYYCRNGESIYEYLEDAHNLDKDKLKHYLEAEFAPHATLVAHGQDTLQNRLSHYEYSYYVTPYERINLVFDDCKERDWPLELHIYDFISGNNLVTRFEPEDYFDQPGLKTI